MQHFPVMCVEAMQGLNINPDGIYVDCTFGRGGHSTEILRQLGGQGQLLALDRDEQAIASTVAITLLQDGRFELLKQNFSNLYAVAAQKQWLGKVDGVLLDAGVSSPQLDDAQRGFSFMRDGPLDMRMDASSGVSAAQWLSQVEEKELVRVLFDYGEERYARRIARNIVTYREREEIYRTRQLVEIIENSVPFKEKNKHPATRSFQAIRIQINQELQEIEAVLEHALSLLKPGGRLVVIAFHSLEDRLVKRFIRNESRGKYSADKLPIQNDIHSSSRLKRIGKAMRATAAEVQQNARSRSAVLRVAERV